MFAGMYNGSRCRVSEDSPNQSICITGLSGTGKTTLLNLIELTCVEESQTVIVIDTGKTHAGNQIFPPVREKYMSALNRLDAMDGLDLGLFKALKTPEGKMEPFTHLVNSAVCAFGSAQNLGVLQEWALRKAVISAIENRGSFPSDAAALEFGLESQETDCAYAVLNKLWTILNSGVMQESAKPLLSSKINIIDLSGADTITQNQMSEMFLRSLWRKIQYQGLSDGQKGLTLVLDEFQRLPLKNGAILNDMLREGRKYGLSLVLATQSLEAVKRDTQIFLNQAATRLYFRPAPNEARNMAKQIEPGKAAVWEKILLGLKVGEYVGTGDFLIDGLKVKRPLRLKSTEKFA